MRKIYISLVLVIITFTNSLFATTWNINTTGNNTFSPNLVTITLGDTVRFTIGSSHNAVEISQATWNVNGTMSNGGFIFGSGIFTFVPTLVQTYYYICTPHAGQGMKGRIIVNTNTGINSPSAANEYFQVFPNPVSATAQVILNIPYAGNYRMSVFNNIGKRIFVKENISPNEYLKVMNYAEGIYFVEIKTPKRTYTRKIVVAGTEAGMH